MFSDFFGFFDFFDFLIDFFFLIWFFDFWKTSQNNLPQYDELISGITPKPALVALAAQISDSIGCRRHKVQARRDLWCWRHEIPAQRDFWRVGGTKSRPNLIFGRLAARSPGPMWYLWMASGIRPSPATQLVKKLNLICQETRNLIFQETRIWTWFLIFEFWIFSDFSRESFSK